MFWTVALWALSLGAFAAGCGFGYCLACHDAGDTARISQPDQGSQLESREGINGRNEK